MYSATAFGKLLIVVDTYGMESMSRLLPDYCSYCPQRRRITIGVVQCVELTYL